MASQQKVVFGSLCLSWLCYRISAFTVWMAAGLAAILLLVAGCAKEPLAPPPMLPRPTMADETQAMLRLGQERLAKGQNPEAADAFRAALKMRTTPTQIGEARLGLAKALADSGENALALGQLKELLDLGALPSAQLEASLMAARLERDLKQLPAAANRLRNLLSHPLLVLKPQERRQAVGLLAEVLEAQGQYALAAINLLHLAPDTPPQELSGLAGRLALVAGQAPSREVEPLLSQAADPILRAGLTLALAKARLREGKMEQAEIDLNSLRQQPAVQFFLPQVQALALELGQARQVQYSAVGVILPLSGPYESHGLNVLAAVELGLDVFSDGERSFTLFIEDSGNDPKQAVEAMTRLADERKVMAVIGPLDGASALAAARQAQSLRVPLISPSVVEGLTRAGDYVFQNFFTPADQVNALLEEAMDRRGLKRLAVLAPRTAYGQGFAKHFDAGVLARGGQVVRAIFYDPNQTDFSADIRQVALLTPSNFKGARLKGPQPSSDIEALFIPDNVERVGLILPQLVYNGVIGLTLLGTSLWHNPKLLESGNRFLQNSIIPDAFDLKNSAPQVAAFVTEFHKAMAREPNVIDAHGYDSALLLRSLLQGPQPPHTRQAMREALTQVKGVSGVCGELSMGPDRRVQKPLSLFTVRGDAFRRLEDSPTPASDGASASELVEEFAPPAQPALPAPAATIPR
ncbi:branched-chain amino acid transport system substrate-binding protein [Desulfarculales bacterium]